jgi:hypothetical protein
MIRMDEHFYNGATRDIADLAKNVRATSTCEHEMTPLPANFEPGSMDVICARGKEAHSHPGNRRFRLSVSMILERYSKATTKLDKSLIVSSIVDTVRQASPHGGFIKKQGGCWFEVGDHVAREKIGQSFRDLLHTKYKSSTKAKKHRRQVQQAKLGDEVDHFMKSAGNVGEKIEEITSQAKIAAPDSRMNILFNQANSELLQQITGAQESGADMSKLEQIIDVEPIRFEDAMSDIGPPALISYMSMDRVFMDHRHSLGPMPDISMSELPTEEALTRSIHSSEVEGGDEDSKPEALHL